MSKKIIFVTSVDLSGTAGSSIATLNFVRGLLGLTDVKVTVLAPIPSDCGCLSRNVLSALTGIFPSRRKGSILWHIAYSLYVRKFLRKAIEEHLVDLVIVRVGPYFSAAAAAMEETDVELVSMVRGSAYAGTNTQIQKYLGWLIRTARSGILRRSSRVLIAFTHALSPREYKLLGDKVEIAANAADLSLMTVVPKNEAREKLLNEMGITLSGKTIAFVGSLRDRHRLPELIMGLSELKLRQFTVDLLLVGSGPLLSSIRQMSEDLNLVDNIKFIGAVPHVDVSIYLCAADIVYGPVDPINPSNPIKVYEGLSVGRPVVTSKTPELEFIADNAFGVYVADTATPTDIATSLISAFALPWSTEKESEARAYIGQFHTWDALAKQAVGKKAS